MLFLFTPRQGLHFLPRFHSACVSDPDFDCRSSDYLGPFLVGSCLLWCLGTFCRCKHAGLSDVLKPIPSLSVGDILTAIASVICRSRQTRRRNHWSPSQLYSVIPGHQHDSVEGGSGTYRPRSVLGQSLLKVETYAYIQAHACVCTPAQQSPFSFERSPPGLLPF